MPSDCDVQFTALEPLHYRQHRRAAVHSPISHGGVSAAAITRLRGVVTLIVYGGRDTSSALRGAERLIDSRTDKLRRPAPRRAVAETDAVNARAYRLN